MEKRNQLKYSQLCSIRKCFMFWQGIIVYSMFSEYFLLYFLTWTKYTLNNKVFSFIKVIVKIYSTFYNIPWLVLTRTKLLSVYQILANWCTDLKFKAEANLKALVPKSKRSSILIYEIHVYKNAKAWSGFIVIGSEVQIDALPWIAEGYKGLS